MALKFPGETTGVLQFPVLKKNKKLFGFGCLIKIPIWSIGSRIFVGQHSKAKKTGIESLVDGFNPFENLKKY